MLRKCIAIVAIILCVACSKEKEGNLKITGNIDGLKEGTLFLQKIKDSSLVNLDSVVVKGDANFVLTTTIDEPEVLYLYLDKKDFNDLNDRIDFFAEPGEMTINTNLRRFVNDVEINGSESNKDLESFKEFMTQFNTKELMLIREGLEAQKEEDTEKLTEINTQINNYAKTRMKYILNYAFTNKDKVIVPYVVAKEASDANVRFLDTIYQQLPPKIAASKYGKELKELVEKRKAESQQ